MAPLTIPPRVLLPATRHRRVKLILRRLRRSPGRERRRGAAGDLRIERTLRGVSDGVRESPRGVLGTTRKCEAAYAYREEKDCEFSL